MKVVLSIAASDSSAGAGIQQDVKTVASLGHYCVTALTALTAQSTLGVSALMPVPPRFFRQQLTALLADVHIDAVKIGVLPSLDIAQATVDLLRSLPSVPSVFDPHHASTSGWAFHDAECDAYIRQELLPLATVVTPNIPEACHLLDASSLPRRPARTLANLYRTSFLLKGGHAQGLEATDTLCSPGGRERSFSSPRIDSRNLHGTGCTLSSALALALALGHSLPRAVAIAKRATHKGIERGRELNIGQGRGPLWLFPLKP